MRHVDRLIMDAVQEERTRLSSRRGFLAGGAKLAAGGALAVAGVAAAPKLANLNAYAQDFEDDVAVLNYALTLEHLEYAFYRDGIGLFTFGSDAFGFSIDEFLAAIRDHEGAHVATLTDVITSLGGTPVVEGAYNFADAYASVEGFLATAAALENTGVSAYDGAGASIESPDLLTAAGTIVAVEARHAAYLNLLNGELPFPAAVETPLTPDEVLEIAAPFLAAAGTPEA